MHGDEEARSEVQSPPPNPQARRRPTGILLLAVLAALDGIFDTVAGITALVGAAAVDPGARLNGGPLTLAGLVILVIAFLLFCLAYGLWRMRPWAWSLGVTVEAANVVLAFVRLASGHETYTGVLLTLVIAGTILYYLMQRPVRAVFGRA